MFSKKPAQPPRNQAPNPMASNATFSVIGADVVIRGNIEASADLHVDGRIEGDIACAALVQGEGSVIMGAITTRTARLAGEVKGTINSRELVILKTARIEGDVHYDALTIEQGAQVEGRLSHQPLSTAANAGANLGEQDGEPRLTLAG